MKPAALLALTIPAALVAQAPAQNTLAAQYSAKQKAEAADADRLAKAFYFDQAVEKAAEFAKTPLLPMPSTTAEALLAAPASVQEHVQKSLDVSDANIAILNGQVAYATALRSAGQWEKSVEVQTQAVAAHKQSHVAFQGALRPVIQMWEKLDADAKAFVSTNETKVTEAKAFLTTERARIEKAWEEAKTKKLPKPELDKLNADTNTFNQKAPEMQNLVNEYEKHKGTLGRVDTVKKQLKDLEKQIENVGSVLEKNLALSKKQIDDQKKEIDEFNAKQVAKKKKVDGAKQWVAAVLEEQKNLGGIEGNFNKMAFLNRLAILDPDNKRIPTLVANIKADKDPYFVEPKGKGKGKAKK